MVKKQTILITGGSGLVGSALIASLKDTYTVISPAHHELDITNALNVENYLSVHKPDIVIHAAAFTDNTLAERERGDTNGICWKTNVEGTKNIAEEAKRIGAFLIFISTGSVFAGNTEYPGPFTEKDPVTPESWYGYTKSCAEKYIDMGAVIRISHPLCNDKRDYLHKLIELYDSHALYPLFTDQFFPITDLRVLSQAIVKIISDRKIGIYHVVSRDLVSPFELLKYALKKMHRNSDAVVAGPFHTNDKRLSQFSALGGDRTQKTLQLSAYSWKDVVDRAIA